MTYTQINPKTFSRESVFNYKIYNKLDEFVMYFNKDDNFNPRCNCMSCVNLVKFERKYLFYTCTLNCRRCHTVRLGVSLFKKYALLRAIRNISKERSDVNENIL